MPVYSELEELLVNLKYFGAYIYDLFYNINFSGIKNIDFGLYFSDIKNYFSDIKNIDFYLYFSDIKYIDFIRKIFMLICSGFVVNLCLNSYLYNKGLVISNKIKLKMLFFYVIVIILISTLSYGLFYACNYSIIFKDIIEYLISLFIIYMLYMIISNYKIIFKNIRENWWDR